MFFLSGFSALVLEIAFVILLRYWVGNTAHAIAAVLSAFMGGLALGSFGAGRCFVGAKRLLPLYGTLELLTGLYALGMPGTLERWQPSFLELISRLGPESAAARAGNFFTGIAVLIIPTLLMGATFPVVVRAASQGAPDRPEPAERLYAANLVGAALGALLVDFFLIRFWGIGTTIDIAAAIDLVVAMWAWALGLNQGPSERTVTQDQVVWDNESSTQRQVLAVAMTSGFLVLFQEIVWSHMSGEFLDNSVYGFAVTLFVVMAALAAGALIVPRHFSRRSAEPSIAWASVCAGALVILLTPFWDEARVLAIHHPTACVVSASLLIGGTAIVVFPGFKRAASVLGSEAALVMAFDVYRKQHPDRHIFWTHHTVDFSVSILFTFLPAVMMGLILPLVLGWHLETRGGKARSVAGVYGANTLGCLMGIGAATFGLIPRLGIEWSARAAGLAFLSLGLILWATRAKDPARAIWVLIPAIVWTAIIPRWDFSKDHAVLGHPGRVVYAREDLNGGITTVLGYAGVRQIYANGIYEAGNDYETLDQARCALLPLLHVRATRHATVVGVGSGQTAGIIGLWPFQTIDVVDYSPAVLEAAGIFFESINFEILKDPRVQVQVTDGRHYLGTHAGRADLIAIEVSRLWQAGEGDLYTREFYEIASSRLEDAGILEQWVPLFDLSIPDTVILLRTVRAVFPYVALYMGSASGMIMASRSPIVVYAARLKETGGNLRLRGVLKNLDMSGAEGLLGDCVLTPQGLDAMLVREKDKTVSTDLWPHLEYSNARYHLGHSTDAPLRRFLMGAEAFHPLPVTGADEFAARTLHDAAEQEHRRLVRSLPPA